MHEYMLENKLKPVVNKDSVLPELKKDSEALLRKSLQEKNTSRKTQYSFPRKRITQFTRWR